MADGVRPSGLNRQPSRLQTFGRTVKRATEEFFGLSQDQPCGHQSSWHERRSRLASSAISGGIKDEFVPKTADLGTYSRQTSVYDPLHVGGDMGSSSMIGMTPGSSTSTYYRNKWHKVARQVSRKESVVKMAIAAMKPRVPKLVKPGGDLTRSFKPPSLTEDEVDAGTPLDHHPPIEEEDEDDEVFFDIPERKTEPGLGGAHDLPDHPMARGWRRAPPEARMSVPEARAPTHRVGMTRIVNKVLTDTKENSDRRTFGMGVVGRLFQRSFRRERITSSVKKQISEMSDYRPYFTYWVTFVQIVVFIVAVSVYGIAPIDVEDKLIEGEVFTSNLAIEQVSYYEKSNMWIGPRQADLIHLGAKFSPCMRRDQNILTAIAVDRIKEEQTACCVRNDGSGCVQMSKKKCSSLLSTWLKWSSDNPGFEQRQSGTVCHQDPKYCTSPSSVSPYLWKDDITTWPICKETKDLSTYPSHEAKHMTCKISGRPCCIGIHGECIITTSEHCQFRRGYFHEEATLCSQVTCMSQICGMIPFAHSDHPDQAYRLWIALFLHAGLFHLVITVLFQFFIMRDVEKLAGAHRIAIIYLGSGLAGNLSSAIFLPYHVEAGPAGAQFGILACLFVEVIQSWPMLKKPHFALLKLGGVTVALFILGLLPWIDNYAHLIGFVFGILLAFVLLPYVTFGEPDRKRKLIGIIVCSITVVILLLLLFIFFYVLPIYECPNCHYFNCIPFTPKFCDGMEVKVTRSEQV